MRKHVLFLSIICLPYFTKAQNVGIGIANPTNKLTVSGNLVVSQPAIGTNTLPTPAQTKTMVNGTSTDFLFSDSTGRIYDPGGPSGNYVANLSASSFINGDQANLGIQITIESMDLGTGDSLIIGDGGGNRLMVMYNGYTPTGTYTFAPTSHGLFFQFKSNADASVGAGFSILWKALAGITQPDATNYTAHTLLYDVTRSALRMGTISNAFTGYFSTAMGENAVASGNSSAAFGRGQAVNDYAMAFGLNTYATGVNSTSMGYGTTATAGGAFSFGDHTIASGVNSVAGGYTSVASGAQSIAFGVTATALGPSSTAIGTVANATSQGSTSIGYFTSARSFRSVVFGSYNDSIIGSNTSTWLNNDPLLIIGNGTADNSRSNALVITKAGNVGIGFNVPLQKLEVNGVTRTLGLRVDGSNIGTTFKQIQGNTAIVGTGNAGVNAYGLAFTYAFANPPKITCTAHSVVNTNDMFVVTVRNVTTTGFVAMVYRIDPPNGGAGWGQALQLDWMAWEQ